MSENTIKPQGKRLKEFIDKTGMPLREFARQCGLASFNAIHNVLNKGQQPTDKLLRAIIKRFPQLSYDWVILGSGEMYVTGSDSMQSQQSAELSNNSRNNQINAKLEMHDYSLNELNNVIKSSMNNLDKKMDLNVDIIASVNLKIDTAINNLNVRVNDFVSKQEEQNDKAIKDFENLIIRLESSNIKNEKIIRDSLKDTTFLIEKLIETSMEAIKLGKQALSENKEALKEFGRGLEGYAKERDKKAEEITLVNVQKLFRKLVETPKKADLIRVGTYTKAKKS